MKLIQSVAAVLAIAAAPAFAAPVYDTLTVYDASHGVAAQVQSTTPGDIHYLVGVDVDASLFGNYSTLVDAGGNVLEVVGIASGGPDGLDLSFAIGYPIGAQNSVLASGAAIDVTRYLSASLQDAGDTAWFTASSVSVVPEPASIAMLLAGLAVVAPRLRRTAKQA